MVRRPGIVVVAVTEGGRPSPRRAAAAAARNGDIVDIFGSTINLACENWRLACTSFDAAIYHTSTVRNLSYRCMYLGFPPGPQHGPTLTNIYLRANNAQTIQLDQNGTAAASSLPPRL
jgi:hypothetical protein